MTREECSPLAPAKWGMLGLAVVLVLTMCAGCTREFALRSPSGKPSSSAAKRSPGTVEFYWLKDIRNTNNPAGKWKIEYPVDPGQAIVFTTKKGERIDSLKQPELVMEKVVRNKENRPIITTLDILPNANATINSRNKVVITIGFDNNGTRRFADFTRAHVGDVVAVFYNGRLMAAPTVNEAIPGGHAEISGFKTLEEAYTAAKAINGTDQP